MRSFFREHVTPFRWGIIGAFAITQLLVLVWLWDGMGGDLGPLNSGYELTAQLTDGHSLQHAADVRMDGVTIGRVREIGLTEDHHMKVRFQVDEASVLPMREGMTVLPRVKSLLDDVYLEITPGPSDAPALEDGAVLPLEASIERVQLDEVLGDLDPQMRADAETLLADLGEGFGGRAAELNDLATALGPLGEDGRQLFTTLVETQADLEGVIDDTAVLLEVLDERDAQLVSLVDDASTLAAATARQNESLSRAVQELPGTISQLRDTSPSITRLSDELDPVVRDLAAAAPDLNHVAENLGPTAEELTAALPDTDRVLDQLPPLLDTFPESSAAVRDLLGPAPEVLSHINPALRYLAPYAPELASMFATSSDAFSSRDENGHYVRFLVPMLGPESVGEMPTKTIRTNAYPRPGQLGNWTEFSGEFPVIEPDPIPNRPTPEGTNSTGESDRTTLEAALADFRQTLGPVWDLRYETPGSDDPPDELQDRGVDSDALDAAAARASNTSDAPSRTVWLSVAVVLLVAALRASVGGVHRARLRRRMDGQASK